MIWLEISNLIRVRAFSFGQTRNINCPSYPHRRNHLQTAAKMVSAAASARTPLKLAIRITSSKSRLHQFQNSFLINVPRKHVSVSCSGKFPGMEHFHEPAKLIVLLNNTKEKLWDFMPDSVKSFPWKKAENVARDEFLALGKETLKWSLLACFAFICLSDILYSISRNKELVIPLGLLVGIMTTKFLDEICRDLMPDHQDGRRITWRLLRKASFFLLVKVSSAYFSGVNDFLVHFANGGIMQVLWNWKEIQKLDGKKSS